MQLPHSAQYGLLEDEHQLLEHARVRVKLDVISDKLCTLTDFHCTAMLMFTAVASRGTVSTCSQHVRVRVIQDVSLKVLGFFI
jgi:hypothetical protein